MKRKELIDAVYTYISTHPGTSYVELEHLFERCGFAYEGDCFIRIDNLVGQNVYFWFNWNEDAIEILNAVLEKVAIDICHPWVYMADGKMPNLPIAKQPKRNYKDDRWLPVTFSIS